MGIVVAAHHMQLDERVAIKFLLPEVMSSPDTIARFDREARAAVKIKSEHVARVIDVGRLENGAPYMVMEYLDGSDLAAFLEQRGALPFEQVAEFVIQACEAIAEAHALGIVHRDLKPANLFCVRRADGLLSVKVLDFGISKLGAAGSSSEMGMTRTNAIFGSPLYMSPEQMQSSRSVDARADIWSLGAIIYQLATNRSPFESETMPELVLKIVGEAPTAMARLRPDVPPALEAIVFRCLEKDRERRYPNVAELAVALGAFAPVRAQASVERISRVIEMAGLGRPTRAPEPPPRQSGAVKSLQASTAGSWTQTAPEVASGMKRGVVLVGLVGVLAVGAAVGGLVLFSKHRQPSPTGASAASQSPTDSAIVATQPTAATSAATALEPVASVSAAPSSVTSGAGGSARVDASPSNNTPAARPSGRPRDLAPSLPPKPAVPNAPPSSQAPPKNIDYGHM
jgi:serine/threonine-protein kinase